MSDAYDQPKRELDGGFATTFVLSAADTTQTLIAAKTGPIDDPHQHTIHIQRVRILVRTGAAHTITLEDESGVDVTPGAVDTSTAGTEYVYDFGPQGHPLTAGEDLIATISAAGSAMDVVVEGFQRRGDPIVPDFTLSAATLDVHATLALTLTAVAGILFPVDPDSTMTLTIDGHACTAVTRASATSITATVPAVGHGQSEATGAVVLTLSDGTVITSTHTFAFTESAYAISNVNPAGGATAGGDAVTLTGYYFGAGVGVTFGGVAATSVVPNANGLTCTCVTPAHGAGAVDVVFLNTDATTATAAAGFLYA